MRLQQSNKTTISAFANQLYDEIKEVWEMANIPMVERKTCIYRITVLLNSWKKQRCRQMLKGSSQETAYQTMLDTLCSMTYEDLEKVKTELSKQKLLRGESSREQPGKETWRVDYDFLLNQMKNPQIGFMGGRDEVLKKKVEKKIKHEQERIGYVNKEKTDSNERCKQGSEKEIEDALGGGCPTKQTTDTDSESRDGSASNSQADPDYAPPRRVRKPKRLEKIMLELPTKDLVKDMAPLCARLKLSQRAMTSLYAKIILSGGGELKDFVLSKSSTWRHRIEAEKEVETKMKLRFKDFSASKPYGILHWDGKKVKFQSGDVEEHLVICLQNVSSDTQPQFIGAPQTPDGTGAAQCEALVRYVDQCGVEDQIIGHVWDTTSSNTRKNIGTAKLLDVALRRANLWLGCRRHASKHHIVHANEAVCGKTSSPEEPLFKMYKQNFSNIDTDDLQSFPWGGDEVSPFGPYKFATERALEVKDWAEACCTQGSFPREDYRELLELLTHVLGGRIKRKSKINKDAPPRDVTFRMEQPGAYHHARFMAKAIYYLKMYMTLPQLRGMELVTDIQESQIERMALFIILIYGQYFLQTALTTAAPRLDLTLWRNVKRYMCVDVEISDSVEASIHRQMFYLTEELVVLALADKGTTDSEKELIVSALLQADRPQSFAPIKPTFKVDLLIGKAHDTPTLVDFIAPRSWLIFDLFDVDVQWMEYPACQWNVHPEYIRFSSLLNSIICVNDVAERNVKNVCDYAEYSKDPERRDRAVIVVNYHRELLDFHHVTKEELSNL